MRAWLWYIMPTPFAFWVSSKLAPRINSGGAKLGSDTVAFVKIYRGRKKLSWYVARQVLTGSESDQTVVLRRLQRVLAQARVLSSGTGPTCWDGESWSIKMRGQEFEAVQKTLQELVGEES